MSSTTLFGRRETPDGILTLSDPHSVWIDTWTSTKEPDGEKERVVSRVLGLEAVGDKPWVPDDLCYRAENLGHAREPQ